MPALRCVLRRFIASLSYGYWASSPLKIIWPVCHSGVKRSHSGLGAAPNFSLASTFSRIDADKQEKVGRHGTKKTEKHSTQRRILGRYSRGAPALFSGQGRRNARRPDFRGPLSRGSERREPERRDPAQRKSRRNRLAPRKIAGGGSFRRHAAQSRPAQRGPDGSHPSRRGSHGSASQRHRIFSL